MLAHQVVVSGSLAGGTGSTKLKAERDYQGSRSRMSKGLWPVKGPGFHAAGRGIASVRMRPQERISVRLRALIYRKRYAILQLQPHGLC